GIDGAPEQHLSVSRPALLPEIEFSIAVDSKAWRRRDRHVDRRRGAKIVREGQDVLGDLVRCFLDMDTHVDATPMLRSGLRIPCGDGLAAANASGLMPGAL